MQWQRLHCFQKQLYAMQNDKKFLEKEGADFEEINIDEQPEKIDYVKSLGFTAAPVIEAGDIVFSGFQPAKLKEIL